MPLNTDLIWRGLISLAALVLCVVSFSGGAWWMAAGKNDIIMAKTAEIGVLDAKNQELDAAIMRQNKQVEAIANAGDKLQQAAAQMQKDAGIFNASQQRTAQQILQTRPPGPGVDHCAAAVAAFNAHFKGGKP